MWLTDRDCNYVNEFVIEICRSYMLFANLIVYLQKKKRYGFYG